MFELGNTGDVSASTDTETEKTYAQGSDEKADNKIILKALNEKDRGMTVTDDDVPTTS
jgi:hypothetical protein